MIVLMTLFNCFSHGTQDLYPLYLQVEKGYGTDLAGKLSIIGPIGAIVGGLFFGALSEKIGRKKAIMIAAALSLPILWPWAFGTTPLMLGLGAFWLQVMVQGAWGVVPVHLNELSPDAVPWLWTSWAEANDKHYGQTMAEFIGVVAVLLVIVTALGPEAKGQKFGAAARTAGASQPATT